MHLYLEDEDFSMTEREASITVHKIKIEVESVLGPKAKLKWVQFGDDNSHFVVSNLKSLKEKGTMVILTQGKRNKRNK